MRAYLTLALMLLISLSAMAAETPQTPVPLSGAKPQTTYPFVSRTAVARLVRDMATWDFASTAKSPNWMVAEVTPQVDEKRFYTRAPASSYEGTVTVVTPLSQAPEKTLWPYRYERKGNKSRFLMHFDLPDSEWKEYFSPFREPPFSSQTRNLMLLALPQSIGHIETPNDEPVVKFPDFKPFFITEAALPYVVPAQKFILANRELFAFEKAAANKPRLLGILENENPFLFAAAARTLAQGGQLDSKFIKQRLLKLDRLKQGVFVYTILLYSPEESGKVAVEAIKEAIGEANRIPQLDGLGVGVICALMTYNKATERNERETRSKGVTTAQTELQVMSVPPSLGLFRSLQTVGGEKVRQIGEASAKSPVPTPVAPAEDAAWSGWW